MTDGIFAYVYTHIARLRAIKDKARYGDIVGALLDLTAYEREIGHVMPTARRFIVEGR